jgi:hypothetical protein
MMGKRPTNLHFLASFFDPRIHVLVRVTPTLQPFALVLFGRRDQKNHSGIGVSLKNLKGSFDFNFEQNIPSLGSLRDRRAIEIAKELGVLEKPITLDMGLKRGTVHEDIGLGVLPLPRCPGRPTL